METTGAPSNQNLDAELWMKLLVHAIEEDNYRIRDDIPELIRNAHLTGILNIMEPVKGVRWGTEYPNLLTMAACGGSSTHLSYMQELVNWTLDIQPDFFETEAALPLIYATIGNEHKSANGMSNIRGGNSIRQAVLEKAAPAFLLRDGDGNPDGGAQLAETVMAWGRDAGSYDVKGLEILFRRGVLSPMRLPNGKPGPAWMMYATAEKNLDAILRHPETDLEAVGEDGKTLFSTLMDISDAAARDRIIHQAHERGKEHLINPHINARAWEDVAKAADSYHADDLDKAIKKIPEWTGAKDPYGRSPAFYFGPRWMSRIPRVTGSSKKAKDAIERMMGEPDNDGNLPATCFLMGWQKAIADDLGDYSRPNPNTDTAKGLSLAINSVPKGYRNRNGLGALAAALLEPPTLPWTRQGKPQKQISPDVLSEYLAVLARNGEGWKLADLLAVPDERRKELLDTIVALGAEVVTGEDEDDGNKWSKASLPTKVKLTYQFCEHAIEKVPKTLIRGPYMPAGEPLLNAVRQADPELAAALSIMALGLLHSPKSWRTTTSEQRELRDELLEVVACGATERIEQAINKTFASSPGDACQNLYTSNIRPAVNRGIQQNATRETQRRDPSRRVLRGGGRMGGA